MTSKAHPDSVQLIEGSGVTLTNPPNFKMFDHPPTKKARIAKPDLPIDAPIESTSAPGSLSGPVTVKAEVSDAPIESTSAPVKLEISDTPVQSSSAPVPRPQPYQIRVDPQIRRTLIPTLLECLRVARVATSHEILGLMDAYEPAEDLNYVDVLSEFEDHDVGDAVQIYSTPVPLLAPLGRLGRDRAIALHQFTRDNILAPLGLLETGDRQESVTPMANKDTVEVISVSDSSGRSVELVVKHEDSVELVADENKSVAESGFSDNSSTISMEYTQEERDVIHRWQKGVGGGDSGESEIEDGTVLYSDTNDDLDDVAYSFVSMVSLHEV